MRAAIFSSTTRSSITRRIAPHDAIYGLGRKDRRFDRRGRNFVLWNTDILHPDVLHEKPLHESRPDATGRSTAFDPYYTSIPFFYHCRADAQTASVAGFFIDNGYKANFEFEPSATSTATRSTAANTPSTCSPVRRCATCCAATRSSPGACRRRRSGRSATISAAFTTTRRSGSAGDRSGVPRARHPVRRAVARHRPHGRLPRVHLGQRESFPTLPQHARVDRSSTSFAWSRSWIPA